MTIQFDKSVVIVTREENEPRCTSESNFFFRLKKKLQSMGFDVIKKAPGKDGHLTSAPYYIRERKGNWCIHDGMYQLRMVHLDFNNDGKVKLEYHT